MDFALLKKTCNAVKEKLQEKFCSEGYWQSILSSSALATALSVYALAKMNLPQFVSHIEKGLQWLANNANPDGGWGDTCKSPSNLSTTLLVWATFTEIAKEHTKTLTQAEIWLKAKMGSLEPKDIASAILKYYGKDHTFSAPILTVCALAGCLGKSESTWDSVPQLPFELAVLPRKLFRFLGLEVVSYAIPALIAIGLVRHCHKPTSIKILRAIRNAVTQNVLRLLKRIQPFSGGFLEAIPLTAFVVIALIGAHFKDHEVVFKGIQFLVDSMKEDGSWPIDKNLNTWVTTLAVNALEEEIPKEQKDSIKKWLIQQQFHEEHPFTLAQPGGWGWTNLPGSVPDGDDTSGSLLALYKLCDKEADSGQNKLQSISKGLSWLIELQNSDGGMPTFCRGWSKLPFDQSCPDITAHAISAFYVWQKRMPFPLQKKITRTLDRAIKYLARTQQKNGSWFPLWFGNCFAPSSLNPTYGTSRVLVSLKPLLPTGNKQITEMWRKGCGWLLSTQNPDGGWGGNKGAPSSIEETALAVKALATGGSLYKKEAFRGAQWLIQNTQEGKYLSPTPIGLYFAKLWYFEEMYPVVFTLSALKEMIFL